MKIEFAKLNKIHDEHGHSDESVLDIGIGGLMIRTKLRKIEEATILEKITIIDNESISDAYMTYVDVLCDETSTDILLKALDDADHTASKKLSEYLSEERNSNDFICEKAEESNTAKVFIPAQGTDTDRLSVTLSRIRNVYDDIII